MDNLIVSLNCVIPVFMAIACGYLIKLRMLVPESIHSYLSSICFNILLPLLLFRNAYTADFETAFLRRLIIFLICEVLVTFVLSYTIYTVIIPDHRIRGTAIQATYRTNIAVVGIALAQNLLGDGGAASMAIAIAVLLPIYNVLAVITLETCRGEKVKLKEALFSIAKNPLIISTATGLLVLAVGIKIPSALDKSIDSLGKAGSTMTLVALGMSFSFCNLKKTYKKVISHCFVRLILVPFLVCGAAILFGFRQNDLGVILICCACPMATTVFPMAQEYQSDYELAAQLIVTTSLLSCFTMCLWIFLLKQMGML